MLQLGRNKSRTNVYTIVTLHFWSAVCCLYMSELRLLHNNLSLHYVSQLHLFYTIITSFFWAVFVSKLPFLSHSYYLQFRILFYSFVSVCFLVLDHEAVPDLSLSVSLKSSMIMGTGLQIRLFLHDFYTRLYNTIVTYSFSLTLSLLMKTVKLHFRTHVHVFIDLFLKSPWYFL